MLTEKEDVVPDTDASDFDDEALARQLTWPEDESDASPNDLALQAKDGDVEPAAHDVQPELAERPTESP
jgi:hypothetical protein